MMDKTSNKIKIITFAGLATAIIFILTRFVSFPGPIPPGYINLGDAAIIFFSMIFSPFTAFMSASIGSALADIAYSAFLFAPITFVVKGLEGLLVCYIYRKTNAIIAAVCGGISMVLGYFLSEWFILPLFDKNFGLTVAVSELPFNLIQAAAGIIVGYILYVFVGKILKSYLK